MTKTNQEKMEAMDLKGNPEKMECQSDHREVPKEDAIVKPVEGQKKWHRGRKLIAGRHGEPKELTQGDCGSWWKLPAGRCPVVQEWHGARGMSSGNSGPREFVDRRRNWPQPAGG
jgi:hypothetical protein